MDMLKIAYEHGAMLAKHAWLPDLGTAASAAWDNVSNAASGAGDWLSTVPGNLSTFAGDLEKSRQGLVNRLANSAENVSDGIFNAMNSIGRVTGINSLASRYLRGGVSQAENSNTALARRNQYISKLIDRDINGSTSGPHFLDAPMSRIRSFASSKGIPIQSTSGPQRLQEARAALYSAGPEYKNNELLNRYRAQVDWADARSALPSWAKPAAGAQPAPTAGPVFNPPNQMLSAMAPEGVSFMRGHGGPQPKLTEPPVVPAQRNAFEGLFPEGRAMYRGAAQ